MTAGGDKLDYPGDPSSPAVSLLDAKLHINSTISDAHKGARYLGIDIKNFYLGTPMAFFQYIRVRPSAVPQEVWDDPRYDIPIADDGYVYIEIRRGMYGLKEAGVIAFNQLVQKLAPYGYSPMPFTPGLWRHRTKRTTFVLSVDDFGVKYFSKADAMHLINAVKADYDLTMTDRKTHCGITMIDAGMLTSRCRVRPRSPVRPPRPAGPQHAPHSTDPLTARQPQRPT
jgi:hypothetical protein